VIAHKTPRHRDFGFATAAVDTFANFVPARLTALMIIAASLPLREFATGKALLTVLRDPHKHRSINAGWPEAAAAGALRLRLAGPRLYGGVLADDPWIGNGRAEATAADIRRGLRLFLATCVVHVMIIALLWLRLQR